MITPRYKYYFIHRPPGHHPTTHQIKAQSWIPKREPAGFYRPVWGYIVYSSPLPFDQVYTYGLFPAPFITGFIYQVWRDQGQNRKAVIQVLTDYWGMGKAELEKNHDVDFISSGTLLLKRQGVNLDVILSIINHHIGGNHDD